MQKIKMNKLDICVNHEVLSNSLDVYLVPLKNKKKYFITLGTYFGSTTTSFKNKDGKEINVPNGTAHFLEHKLFANEDGTDAMAFFSKTGSSVNASTSYNNTKYIVLGTKNFKENFLYLTDFVTHPYFTDENVEKEKGIIAQEINMYKDEAESNLDDLLRTNLYNTDNHKYNVAGEVSDINKVTKEDLYECYNTFYNPNNMFLVITGNFDMKDALDVIKNNLEVLENRCSVRKIEQVKEKITVPKEYEKKEENVLIPKMLVGIKIPNSSFKITDPIKRSIYLNIILSVNFGKTSLFYEKMTEDNLLSFSSFYIEDIGDITTIYYSAESTFPDELLDEFKKKLKNLMISASDIDRIKKVYIASEIRGSSYVNSVMSSLVGDLIRYKKIVDDPIGLYESLNFADAMKTLNSLNFDNMSSAIFIPKNIKSYKSKK